MSRTPMMDPMIPVPWTIQSVKEETYDTFTLDLKPPQGVKELRFKPGQINMLYTFGVGEVPISISGDAAKPQILTHTIREVGSVTRAIRKLKKGDVLGVRGPFGHGWPMEQAEGKDLLIIVGGLGLPPLRAVIYHVLAHRGDFQNVSLLYGARTPKDLVHWDEVQKWKKEGKIDVHVTVDNPEKGWKGNTGVVTTLVPKARFDASNVTALICGPEIMMKFSILEIQKLGVKSRDIFVSMERNMKCAVGLCGHCQYSYPFVCKDGAVMNFADIEPFFGIREV